MATKRGTRAKAQRVLSDHLERETVTINLLTEMVVVRESDASDLVLFENMAHKTVAMLIPKHPDFAPLLDDPLGPVLDPDRYGAVVERRKGSKSFQFIFAGVLFLYHLGSAAMVDEDEDINFFTGQFLGALNVRSIMEIYAFAVHRFVRDEGNGTDLGKVFHQRSMKVFTNGQDFDFAQPFGLALWNLAVTIAAQERNGIVERNRLGRIAVARRNQWPHGPNAIPLGYRLEGRTLVPIETERERVREILDLLGNPELSTRQFVERLGMMKVTRPGVKERYGDEATVALVRHPKDIQQSFLNMLSLYETGVYEMPLPNPTKGAKIFGGLPVHRSDTGDPKDFGFVTLRYQFGLPVGGWAPPEVFEAIRAKQQANRAFVNGVRERRAFGGRPPYEVDGITYQLESMGLGRYRVCRLEGSNLLCAEISRPGEVSPPHITAKESLATIDAEELHHVVVKTIIDTLSTRGAAGEVHASTLRVDTDPETTLRLTLEFHRRRAERAREEALRTDDAATAAAFRHEAEVEEGVITALIDGAASSSARPEVKDTIRVDVGPFTAMLAKVLRADLKVPGAVAVALKRLIPELKLFPVDVRGEFGWSAVVRLPTEDGGTFLFAPIFGRVACNVVHRATASNGAPNLRPLALFAQGEPIEMIAEALAVKPATAWQGVRSGLADCGIPEAAISRLSRTPVRELRMLFGALALKRLGDRVAAFQDNPDAFAELLISAGVVPPGADPAWAAGTVLLYFRELSVRATWSAKDPIGQLAVDFVASRGGSCTVEELLTRVGPLEAGPASAISKLLGRYHGFHPAVLQSDGPLRRAPGKRLQRDMMVRLVECPHCGESLTKVLRVTEVPRHLLCVHCRRSPLTHYPFPDSYFECAATTAPRSIGVENPAGPRPTSVSSAHELTRDETQRIIADYRDSSIPIGGRNGILSRHDITDRQLYKVLRANDVPPRQPHRTRRRN